MSNDFYQAPRTDLVASEAGVKNVSEHLTKSRIDMEEAAALSRLKNIWRLRLAGNFVFLAALIYFIALLFPLELDGGLIVLGVFIGMCVLESCVIIAFFQKQAWCVAPLHIFSVLSLLNIPFGTILSVVHFVNINKMQLEKD